MLRKLVVVALSCLIVLSSLILLSCPLATEHLSGDKLIRINLGGAAGRLLGQTEYDVTSLRIVVTGPGGLNEVIDWVKDVSPMSYDLQAYETGTHTITVTHYGVNGDETAEATESTKFELRPYVITVLNVTPGAIGLIVVEGEGDPTCADLVGIWDGPMELPGGPPPAEPIPVYAVFILDEEDNAWLYSSWEEGGLIQESVTYKGTWDCDGSVISGLWTDHYSYGGWEPLSEDAEMDEIPWAADWILEGGNLHLAFTEGPTVPADLTRLDPVNGILTLRVVNAPEYLPPAYEPPIYWMGGAWTQYADPGGSGQIAMGLSAAIAGGTADTVLSDLEGDPYPFPGGSVVNLGAMVDENHSWDDPNNPGDPTDNPVTGGWYFVNGDAVVTFDFNEDFSTNSGG